MINISDPKDCCGCTACASICEHNAIKMQPDALGFLYPIVDSNKCVDCGLCERVCSFNDYYDRSLNLLQPKCYGARHKDMGEVETSRSGAAFIAISDWVLEQGGSVYGAGYTDHFRVVHKRATTKEQRDEFKGSKYVQSDLAGVFRQIKVELKEGKRVLFTGTPCQTSGLNSYIGKKLRENLLLVDIACHGVPGPYLWRDYIVYLEKIQGDEIVYVNFRDKQQFGWSYHKETFTFKSTYKKIWFNKVFYQDIMFRYSCSSCHFCNVTRPSDITIADFWGWEKTNIEINRDDKGLSLIMVNTEKGKYIFENVKKNLITFSAKIEDCLQPNFKHPTPIHSRRTQFEQDYVRYGFKYVFEKDYNSINIVSRCINWIRQSLKLSAKKIF